MPADYPGLSPHERVKEIEREILELMRDATMSLIKIGGLLTEAKRNYAGEDTQDFLAWSEAAFGFKKAYVYRLMNTHRRFGNDPALSQAPLNVLALLNNADDEALAEARSLASRGELDTNAARRLAGKSDAQEERNRAAHGLGPKSELPTIRGAAGNPYTYEQRAQTYIKEVREPDEALTEFKRLLSYLPPEVPDSADPESARLIREMRETIKALQAQLKAFT